MEKENQHKTLTTWLQQARLLDRERVICNMFTQADRRDQVMAIVCFYHEMARLAANSSQELTSLMRFQWWREQLENNQPAHTPLLETIHQIFAESNLNATDLLPLIEMREEESRSDYVMNFEQYRSFARRSSGRLQIVLAKLLDADDNTVKKAELAGMIYGMTGQLRTLRHSQNMANAVASSSFQALNQNRQDPQAIVESNVAFILEQVKTVNDEILSGPVVPAKHLHLLFPLCFARYYRSLMLEPERGPHDFGEFPPPPWMAIKLAIRRFRGWI